MLVCRTAFSPLLTRESVGNFVNAFTSSEANFGRDDPPFSRDWRAIPQISDVNSGLYRTAVFADIRKSE